MLSQGFLFNLIFDLEIPMIFRCRKFKLFLLFSGSFIWPGSQYTVQPCPLFFDTVLILSKNFILFDFCFTAICVNVIFLLFTVCINSSLFRLEIERNSLVQVMQNHLVFFSFWNVCLFILLHSRWTHASKVSH